MDHLEAQLKTTIDSTVSVGFAPRVINWISGSEHGELFINNTKDVRVNFREKTSMVSYKRTKLQ